MSTIKISQLPLAATLNSNTGNTIFAGVDLQVGTTYGYSATVLANKLYSNNVLNVGQSAVTLPNTIAQFSLAGESYVQTNFINTNGGGSADHVITANNGTDSTYFLDLGLANPAYQPGLEFNNIGTAVRPLDGYLYVQGGTTPGLLGGNLIVGTTTTGTQIRFIVGGSTSSNVVANMTSTGLVMSGTAGITTSNITATGNVITSTITTTKGTNNNLLIDPDGTGDVYFPTYTEVFVQSTNDSTGTGSGALQVTGGVTVGANLYAANIYTTGSVTATGSITANNITGQYLYGNVVGSSIANTIQWQATTTPPTQVSGQLWYYANTNSLVSDTDIPGDRPSVGKTLYERVYNNTGTTITAGSWVRLAGGVTSNGNPYIALADATSAANAIVSGFVKNSIAAGAYGFIYTQGNVENTNMSAFSAGDILFISTTPGAASNAAPVGQSLATISIGKVLANYSANGQLQVGPIIALPGYGKANGSVMYANNNLVVGSNTIIINESTQTLTMNGSISLTGGIVTVNNNTFGTTVAAMRIDGSAGFAAQPTSQSGTMMQVIGLANTPTRIIVDSYSTSGNAYPLIAGRQARGTSAAPTASQSGDVLARYSGNGYGATGYSPLGIGRMDFVAAENYTDANKGSYIQFAATPIGSNVISSNVVTISATGLTTNNIIANTATVGGNTVATFVTGTWTPNVIISGATIAYTSANGSYTKIGRQVTAYFTLIGTQNGTSATVSLGNLPFASNTATGSQGVLTMGGPQAMSGTFGLISGNVVSNSTSSALYCLTISGSAFGQAAVTGTILGSPFTLNGMVTYISST